MKEDRIDIQKVITDLQREIPKIKNENDFEHLIKNYLEEQIKDLKNEINIEPLIETVLEHLKIVSNVKPLSEDDEFDKILEDTIKLCFVHKFESELAFEAFKELAKYDKVFHANQGKFFYKIFQMLSIIVQYKELIKKLENLENETVHKRGIAKTKYEDIFEAITPKLNHYEDAFECNDIQENRLANNIAQDFNSNPREINAVLETFDVNLIRNINESEKKTFENLNIFFNSSEKLKDTDLFRSCQISCVNFFKKQQLFETINAPTNEQLANYLNNILNDFFDMYESKLNRNHINKPIQTKTYFQGIEIFEYQTPKNKKEHPIFK